MTNTSSHRRTDTVPTDAAMNALSLVLTSEIFARSNRLSQFLRFVVEQTLHGHEGSVKEYTIGTEAYGRKAETRSRPRHDRKDGGAATQK